MSIMGANYVGTSHVTWSILGLCLVIPPSALTGVVGSKMSNACRGLNTQYAKYVFINVSAFPAVPVIKSYNDTRVHQWSKTIETTKTSLKANHQLPHNVYTPVV